MGSEQLEIADLSEMLGIVYTYQEMGFEKIQMDTAHAIEILERLTNTLIEGE